MDFMNLNQAAHGDREALLAVRSAASALAVALGAVVNTLDLPNIDTPAPPNGMLWGDGFEIETLINSKFNEE